MHTHVLHFENAKLAILFRIFELIFHVAVSKRIEPSLTEFKLHMEELVKSKKMTKKVRTGKVSAKKAELEKESTEYFQERFEGPLGKGLRVFRPEPQKVMFLLLLHVQLLLLILLLFYSYSSHFS